MLPYRCLRLLPCVVLLLLLVGSLRAAETLIRVSFDQSESPFFTSPQSSGASASGDVQGGEYVAQFSPDGSNPSWLVGVRSYYLPTANSVRDRSLLRLSFRLRADFGTTGRSSATVRVRLFGSGTSESADALVRDFVVTSSFQTFATTLDTWTQAVGFDPTREAHSLYFDVGGSTGAQPWPGVGSTRLYLDDIAYEEIDPAVLPPPVEYFVSPTGSDLADGRTPATAFRHVRHAANLTRPGDIVTVLDGVYSETVTVRRSGRADAWITFRAKNRHGALLRPPSGDGFSIGRPDARVGYIVIDGFDIMAAGTFASGIKSSQGAHHLRVVNNYAHDCGESGIQLNDGDHRHIEGNITARNGWLMPEAGSGISLYGLQPYGDAPGWRTIVRGNISFANDNGPTTARTDGNGIIIDDFRNIQPYHTGSPALQLDYDGWPTLVENNLVFANGGRGIQVFKSNNVWVLNNTAHLNNRRSTDTDTWRGEISVSCSARVTVANNLAVTDSNLGFARSIHNAAYLSATVDGPASSGGGRYGRDNFFFNNLGFDRSRPGQSSLYIENIATTFHPADGNLFAAPSLRDPRDLLTLAELADPAAYFGLGAGSPALDAGSAALAIAPRDLADRPRVVGAEIDLGALETQISATPGLLHEVWLNVPGTAVSSIPVASTPSSSGLLPGFETPVNAGDNLGRRLRGYITPEVSGIYTFWLASDDNGELWLSTDERPANRVRIARVTSWTSFRQWNKFNSQRSAPVSLVAGRRYYVEALMKESGGGDHLSVAWRRGTNVAPANGAAADLVPAAVLTPFAP